MLSQLEKKSHKIIDWFSRHFWTVYLIVAGVSFLYMFRYAGMEGFWQDELITLEGCMKNRSLFETLFVTHSNYYPSVASKITHAWYGVSPYGEQWLLLPTVLFTALGNFFTALAAEKIGGRKAGFAAAVFVSFCYPVIYNVGYELRAYGPLYCSAAALLYFFMVKNERLVQSKTARIPEVLFGFWVWFGAGNHVFGVFYAGLLFCVDGILWLKKKIKLRFCTPYFVAAFFYLPWIYNMFCYDVFSISAPFQAAPSLSRVATLLRLLSGEMDLACYIFVLGAFYVVFNAFKNRKQHTAAIYAPLVPLWLIVGLIGFIYFYGTFINTKATMWSNRYFAVLYPCTAILISIAATKLLGLAKNSALRHSLSFILAIVFAFTSHAALIEDISVEHETFRDAADWLYTLGDIAHKDDTAIIFCAWWANYTPWKEYYLEEQGRRAPLNVLFIDHANDESLSKYNTVYLYYEIRNGNPSVNQLLSEQFELVDTNEEVKVKTYVRKDAQ